MDKREQSIRYWIDRGLVYDIRDVRYLLSRIDTERKQAQARERVIEEACTAYVLLSAQYPLIAGRVLALEAAGETVAHAAWAACAQDWHRVEEQLREALAALEKERK